MLSFNAKLLEQEGNVLTYFRHPLQRVFGCLGLPPIPGSSSASSPYPFCISVAWLWCDPSWKIEQPQQCQEHVQSNHTVGLRLNLYGWDLWFFFFLISNTYLLGDVCMCVHRHNHITWLCVDAHLTKMITIMRRFDMQYLMSTYASYHSHFEHSKGWNVNPLSSQDLQF